MTGCFDNSTKVYHRLTSLAIGSANVTVFGTSSILIYKINKLCIVNVVRRRNCCKFGCNVNGACKGVAVNNTVNNVNINVYSGLVTHVSRIIIGIVYIVITVKCPNSYRNAYNCVAKSLTACAVFFNSYSKNFRNCIVIKGSLESGSNNRTFGFPSVRIVQLELCNESIYICEICNVDINVVDGLCLRSFTGVVMTAKFNNSITCNSKGTGNLHGVTKFVLNFKRNSVCTRTESNVTLGGEHIAVDSGFYNNAVNSDLTGGKVKGRIISNSCGESNVVTVDNLAVIKRNSGIGGRIGRSCNGRKNSIVYSRAIVESDIVDIECNYICGIGLYISTDKGRRTAVSFVSCHGHTEIIVLRNVNGCINPSRFRNICIGCSVQVCLLACCSRSEHKVVLLAGIRAVSVLYIELRLECETLACCRECILGNVEPHTESCSLHTVSNVTKNDNLVRNIKENIVRPACKSSIGIVKTPCKSIVAVSYLTAHCLSNSQSCTTEIFVELTCKRI